MSTRNIPTSTSDTRRNPQATTNQNLSGRPVSNPNSRHTTLAFQQNNQNKSTQPQKPGQPSWQTKTGAPSTTPTTTQRNNTQNTPNKNNPYSNSENRK